MMKRLASGCPGLSLLVGVGFAATAAAQTNADAHEVVATPSEQSTGEQQQRLPTACQSGTWDLKGAGFRVGEETAFNPAWVPAIEDIAACLAHPRMERACVNVQGRFDAMGFTADVIAAFGSERAAQEARAQARASRVTNELLKLGVASLKIIQEPPPEHNTFRGVEVLLVADCVMTASATTVVDEARLEAVVTDAVLKRVEELAGRQGDSVSREAVDAMVAEAVAKQLAAGEPARLNHIWVDAQLQLSLLAGSPNAVFAPLIAVGGGWSNDLLYAHVDLGFDVATAVEQRTGFELSASFGYVFQRWPWLELGATAGDRIGAPDPLEPWLEQVWFVGAESSQCLFELWSANETCIQESVVLGGRIRRGQVADDGTIERIANDTSVMVRVDVAVVARHNFL